MPNIPLTIPPGMVKPGTVYDARGRWFGGNLVRWNEGVLQPIGGWSPIQRVEAPVGGAFSDDGGVLTDETADANNSTTGDVVLIPATPAVGDAFYIGYLAPFGKTRIKVGTAASDGVVTWEFWDGAAWVALSGVTDGTNGFKVAGENNMSFGVPKAWQQTTVGGKTLYFIRARVTTAGTTAATGDQIWISAGDIRTGGPIRGMLAWRDNGQQPVLAMGTPPKLWLFRDGLLTDITPVDLVAGKADAELVEGQYGHGAYGVGTYGLGVEGQGVPAEATTWQLDHFGQVLVACSVADGRLFEKVDLLAAGGATPITNAPTGCAGVVVTPERFVVALGASQNDRLVAWSDQENPSTWTPDAANQAGDFILTTPGGIVAGRRGRSETLIWTDADLWAMRYIGGQLVYSFQQIAASCGTVARAAMATADGKAYWMGQRSFFIYDGFVKAIPCEVADYVFGSLNRFQQSKITCYVRPQFGEVTWHYPSGGSTENDRYVAYNYLANHWLIGTLQRTSGQDLAVFGFPIATDANGKVYQHEIVHGEYLDHAGVKLMPHIESGPIDLGAGDQVMMVRQIIPDTKTAGDVTARIYASTFPVTSEVEHGPYTLANPTSTRLTGRQVRLRLDGARSNWRVGTMRFEVVPGGRR